jgi:hypothetical protein
MSGARAKLGIVDKATGQPRIIGLFNSVSYGLTYDTQPAYILGRFSPAEIDYTAANEVNIQCSGFRVIGHGAHREASVPKLQDLLLHEYIELTIIDRQREALGQDARIAKFRNVRPTGYSTGMNARNLSELTVNFVGIMVDDEDTTNTEGPLATALP